MRERSYKPSDKSRDFTIWGTRNSIKDGEVLNDPLRSRSASKREARRDEIASSIDASMKERCPMRHIKGDG